MSKRRRLYLRNQRKRNRNRPTYRKRRLRIIVGVIVLFLIISTVVLELIYIRTVSIENKITEMIAVATTIPTATETPTETAIATPELISTPEPQYKVVIKEKLLEKHSISKSGSSESRNHNMANAARLINGEDKKGLIVNPGERFVWSRDVGATTKEKGFVPAPVIINHQSGMGLGGGVCQVSSTLYSAAYDAGIIKEGKYHAEKHTLKSAYINPSVDHEATVAVDSKPIRDFWFENTLEYPIRIKVSAKNGTVTVKIFLRKEKKIEIK